jgi:hypothetical protein
MSVFSKLTSSQKYQLFSLVWLWRSQLGSILRAKSTAAANFDRLLLASSLFLGYSNSPNGLKDAILMPKTEQRGLVMFLIQLITQGSAVPEFAAFYTISTKIWAWAYSYSKFAGDWGLTFIVSWALLIQYHEFLDSFPATTMPFLRKMTGEPSPLFRAPYLAPLPSGSGRFQGTLIQALDPATNWKHFKGAFPAVFKSFLGFHFVVRPLLAYFRKGSGNILGTRAEAQASNIQATTQQPATPPSNSAAVRSHQLRSQLVQLAKFTLTCTSKALRSSLVCWFSCHLGWIAGRWRVSESPIISLAVRAFFPLIPPVFFHLDDWQGSSKHIYTFLLANSLVGWFNVAGWAIHRMIPELPEELLPVKLTTLMHPVLSALNITQPSAIGTLFLKAMQ